MAIVLNTTGANISTLNGLYDAIGNWTHRSDLVSIYPDIVNLAEVRINGDLDARLMDKKSTLTCVIDQDYVAAPSDIINIRHISARVSPVQTLDYLTPDQFNISFPWSLSGVPQVYTVIGENIHFAPIPDSDYTLDIIYKGQVPSLVSNGSNWLMTKYPNVYLYASLLEISPYLKDDNRMMMWKQAYDYAIESVNAQDWYSGSTMRVRSDIKP